MLVLVDLHSCSSGLGRSATFRCTTVGQPARGRRETTGSGAGGTLRGVETMRVLQRFAPADVAAITALATVVEAATGVVPVQRRRVDRHARRLVTDTRRRPRPGLLVPGDGDPLDAYAHLAHHHAGEWSARVRGAPGLARSPRRAPRRRHRRRRRRRRRARHLLVPRGHQHRRRARPGPPASTLERELLQMRVPLPLADPPRWPDGVRVRSFVARCRTKRRGSRSTTAPSPGIRSRATGRSRRSAQRETEPWFDPEGFLLAFDADGLAGSCWTKVHPAQPPHEPVALGEIYVIGADPAPPRSRASAARSPPEGSRRWPTGASRMGMLFVDAANEAAVGLYRSLGFTTHRTDRAYGRASRARHERRTPVTTRYGASRADVDALLAEWGEPRYRADQVWDALVPPAGPARRRHVAPACAPRTHRRSAAPRADRARDRPSRTTA